MMRNQPQRCARIYHRDREKFRVSSFEFQVVNWNDSTLKNSLRLCGECFQIGRITLTVRNLKLETRNFSHPDDPSNASTAWAARSDALPPGLLGRKRRRTSPKPAIMVSRASPGGMSR